MGVDEVFIAMHFPILAAFMAMILGWSYDVHRHPKLRAIFYYCTVGFLGLTISTYLAKFKIHNIILLWCIMLAHTVILSLYFCRISNLIGSNWKLLLALIMILAGIASLHIKWAAFPPDEYFMNLFIGRCYFLALVTTMVLVHFYDLISSAGAERIDSMPVFWISAALLIYSGGSFIPEVSNVYGFEISQREELQKSRLVRHVLSNFIMVVQYLILSFAFRIHHLQNKSELSI